MHRRRIQPRKCRINRMPKLVRMKCHGHSFMNEGAGRSMAGRVITREQATVSAGRGAAAAGTRPFSLGRWKFAEKPPVEKASEQQLGHATRLAAHCRLRGHVRGQVRISKFNNLRNADWWPRPSRNDPRPGRTLSSLAPSPSPSPHHVLARNFEFPELILDFWSQPGGKEKD